MYLRLCQHVTRSRRLQFSGKETEVFICVPSTPLDIRKQILRHARQHQTRYQINANTFVVCRVFYRIFPVFLLLYAVFLLLLALLLVL
jgi:hypothetical protein